VAEYCCAVAAGGAVSRRTRPSRSSTDGCSRGADRSRPALEIRILLVIILN
jgi:hypothetical protein